MRENKSGLQIKTERNTSNIRGKQRNNRYTKEQQQQKNKRQCKTHRNELLDKNCHFPDLVKF